jgi:hypothetical protein
MKIQARARQAALRFQFGTPSPGHLDGSKTLGIGRVAMLQAGLMRDR